MGRQRNGTWFRSLAVLAGASALIQTANAQSVNSAATIEPASGRWGDSITLKGDVLVTSQGLRAIWYPGDDDTQPPLMSQSVTIYSRPSPDTWQAYIPADPATTGWSGDFTAGVLRLYALPPGQADPVLAARFAIGSGLRSTFRAGATLSRSAPAAASPSTTTGAAPSPAAPAPSTVPGGALRQFNVAGSGARQLVLPEGEGTTILDVTNISSVSATVSWRPVPGATGYQLHASATDLAHVVDGPPVPLPAGHDSLARMSAQLDGLLPGVNYLAWVDVRHSPGPLGRSDQRAFATPLSQNPAGFTATTIGPGAVRLEWQAVAGAREYIVEGSNLPRMRTRGTAVAVSNLSSGTHQWSVIASFGDLGLYNDLSPSTATITLGSAEPTRYRVAINGFRVYQETMDDPLQSDGKADEVYVAVKVEEYDRETQTRIAATVISSPVFGDKNGFPSPTRVLAGTTSSSGGLRRGDVYPGANPAVRTREPFPLTSPIDLPMTIWEGELETGRNVLILKPAIWEWDSETGQSAQGRTSYNGGWLEGFDIQPPAGSIPYADQMDSAGLSVFIDRGTTRSTTSGSAWNNLFHSAGDRPIGFIQTSAPRITDVLGGGVYEYFDRVLVITREKIEAALVPANTSGSLPPGVLAISYRDDPNDDGTLGGDYKLYLQVERLP